MTAPRSAPAAPPRGGVGPAGAPVLTGEQHWMCPNCTTTEVTVGKPNRFHECRGLKGLTAPLVLEGVRAKVEAREREDFVGRDIVTYDGDGRPVMSVVTTRDEGQDVAVMAPCATIRRRDYL